jgi:hypothetical protein
MEGGEVDQGVLKSAKALEYLENIFVGISHRYLWIL